MKDIGHEETEKVLEEIEKRISAEYAQAEKEIAKKLDTYLEKFRVKDELKLKAVANGMITKEEYEQWRLGQVMMGQRWAEMRDSLAQDFTNADKIARSIAYDHMPEVYAINHDYGTFQVEKASQMDTSYTLYDRQAFEQLVKNEDTFIPAPGRKVSRDIKEGKALAWNKKQVQSVMMQGLLQGESIPKLATRLANTVGESDRKAAIRNARTMTTGVQNAGRMASYDRANNMGIETRKQWLATLDNRTRHWHASLDGEVVDNDAPFTNDFGDIMYPGDPAAEPANIFNCRCTLIASIKGFERDVSNTDLRHDDHLGDMTYEEWREGHYDQKSEPITRQDDIAETMQEVYGAEYKKYKDLTGSEEDATIETKYMEQSSDASIPEKYDGDFSDYNKLDLTAEEEEIMNSLHELSMNDNIEHLIAITDGVKSGPFDSGLEGRVKVPEEVLKGENVKLYHSHTNATPLSVADLEKFTFPNVSSVGVVAINGDIYIVNGYHVSYEEYEEAAMQISREVDNDLLNSEDFLSMTLEQRNYVATRETFYRICRYFEWDMYGGRYE